MIETTKYSTLITAIRAQRIQDGGRPPFGKIPLNLDISATV